MQPFRIATSAAFASPQERNPVDFMALDLGVGDLNPSLIYQAPYPVNEMDLSNFLAEISIATGQVTQETTLWVLVAGCSYFFTVSVCDWACFTFAIRTDGNQAPAFIYAGYASYNGQVTAALPALSQSTLLGQYLVNRYLDLRIQWQNIELKMVHIRGRFADQIGVLS